MDALEAHLAQKAKARRTRNALVRAKAKAYRNSKVLYPFPEGQECWEDVERYRAQYVKWHYRNRHNCSGMWCGHGNPRRYRGINLRTLQECRSDYDFRDQLHESIP